MHNHLVDARYNIITWPEDRATLGSDPSAEQGGVSQKPGWFQLSRRFPFVNTSESDKPKTVILRTIYLNQRFPIHDKFQQVSCNSAIDAVCHCNKSADIFRFPGWRPAALHNR